MIGKTRWAGDIVPCSRERPSDPWRPAWRSSRRSRARQRRPRPIVHRQPHSKQHHTAREPGLHRGSPGTTYNGEVLERPGLLNVLERLLEVLELHVDLVLGGLGVLHRLDLEGLDGLELPADIVGGGLEGGEALLDLVHDGLVLQDGAVVREVDLGGLLLEQLELAAGVVVALLKGVERGDRLAAEAERRRDLGPVELDRSASLFGEEKKLARFPGTREKTRPATRQLALRGPDEGLNRRYYGM